MAQALSGSVVWGADPECGRLSARDRQIYPQHPTGLTAAGYSVPYHILHS